VPDYAQRGPELGREVRGLRVWLPLHLHGVSAFRAALDEKLDLAERADAELRTLPSLELPWRPQLSTVAFRVRPRGSTVDDGVVADRATRELIGRVNLKGRVLLAGTVIGGRYTARLCVLSHRTHDDRITEAVDTTRTEAVRPRGCPSRWRDATVLSLVAGMWSHAIPGASSCRPSPPSTIPLFASLRELARL
jgi:aromatic-L-amino-acid decarboxylase